MSFRFHLLILHYLDLCLNKITFVALVYLRDVPKIKTNCMAKTQLTGELKVQFQHFFITFTSFSLLKWYKVPQKYLSLLIEKPVSTYEPRHLKIIHSFLLDHVDDIITLVFQYINMLRFEGYQEWILQEERVSSLVWSCAHFISGQVWLSASQSQCLGRFQCIDNSYTG